MYRSCLSVGILGEEEEEEDGDDDGLASSLLNNVSIAVLLWPFFFRFVPMLLVVIPALPSLKARPFGIVATAIVMLLSDSMPTDALSFFFLFFLLRLFDFCWLDTSARSFDGVPKGVSTSSCKISHLLPLLLVHIGDGDMALTRICVKEYAKASQVE